MEAHRFLSDFVLMDRLHWTPRDIETLSDFEYEAILSIIDTLNSIEKAEREKEKSANQSGNGRRTR